LYKSFLNQAY